MNFLMVQNPVRNIPDVELLSVLGLSGSRGQDGKIGMFGSGWVHGLAVLARTEDPGNPGFSLLERTKLCMGTAVFTFKIDRKHAKTATGSRVDASTIVMKQQNGATYPLNVSVDFGSNDWTEVTLAIREVISNAIDGTYEFGGTPAKDVVIDTSVSDEPRMLRAKDGFIRVYIPLTEEISNYIDDLHKYFKCLAPGYSPDRKVFLNVDGGPARVYRKGVLVGSFGTSSLFHYNINNITINESRLVDSYTARHYCAFAIATCESSTMIAKYLLSRMGPKKDGLYENDLYVDNMRTERMYCSEEEKEAIAARMKEGVSQSVGHRVVCDSPIAAKIVQSKGMEPVLVDSSLATILKEYGAKTASDVLNHNELQGKIISEATSHVVRMTDYVWDLLCKYDMTNGKSKPNVMCFAQSVCEGGMSGYYRPGGDTIYVRNDHADGVTTYTFSIVIEEIVHWVTGASDETRELQTFAFNLAAKLVLEDFR